VKKEEIKNFYFFYLFQAKKKQKNKKKMTTTLINQLKWFKAVFKQFLYQKNTEE
jgi:hypothetical protein